MAKKKAVKGKSKIKRAMKEFSDKTLRSGSKKGPKVKSKAQALAIGYSEQAKADESKGMKKALKKKKK